MSTPPNLAHQRAALGTEVDSLDGWTGAAAAAARAHFDGLGANLTESVGLVERIGPVLRAASRVDRGARAWSRRGCRSASGDHRPCRSCCHRG